MANMSPWHSIVETDPKVYHADSRYPDGNAIAPKFRREGTDGRRKCEECRKYS